MSPARLLVLWCAAAFLVFVFAPFFRSADEFQDIHARDLQQARNALGAHASGVLERWSSLAVHRSAPAPGRSAQAAGCPVRDRLVAPVCHWYAGALERQARLTAHRLAVLGFWAVLLAPLVLAAVVDGLMVRAVKRAAFGSMRPAAFKAAALVLAFLAAAPLLYLVLPLPWWAFWVPAWVLFLTWPLSLLLANSQPLFGR